MLILKHLEEIKRILTNSGYRPGKFLSDCVNKYMICGNIILVKAKICGTKYMHRYGYFLIDKEDKDLLCDKNFYIYSESRNGLYKNPNIGVYYSNNHSKSLLRKLLKYKYPFKNKDSRYYIHKNGNTLDLRKISLEESLIRTKNSNNKSGKTGVSFDKTHNRWVAKLLANGKILRKYFPVSKYGNDARNMATDARDKWEEKFV